MKSNKVAARLVLGCNAICLVFDQLQGQELGSCN